MNRSANAPTNSAIARWMVSSGRHAAEHTTPVGRVRATDPRHEATGQSAGATERTVTDGDPDRGAGAAPARAELRRAWRRCARTAARSRPWSGSTGTARTCVFNTTLVRAKGAAPRARPARRASPSSDRQRPVPLARDAGRGACSTSRARTSTSPRSRAKYGRATRTRAGDRVIVRVRPERVTPTGSTSRRPGSACSSPCGREVHFCSTSVTDMLQFRS